MNPMCTRALCPKMPGCETSVTVPSTGVPLRKMTDRPIRTSAATSNWTGIPSLTVAESIGARNLRGTEVPAGTSTSSANAGREPAPRITSVIAAATLRICASPPHRGGLPGPERPVVDATPGMPGGRRPPGKKDSRRPRILPLPPGGAPSQRRTTSTQRVRPSAGDRPRASRKPSRGCPETYDRPCALSGLIREAGGPAGAK